VFQDALDHVILSGRGDRREDDHFFTAFRTQFRVFQPHLCDESGPVFLFDLVELTVLVVDDADIFWSLLVFFIYPAELFSGRCRQGAIVTYS